MNIRKTALLLAMALSLTGCSLRDSVGTETDRKNPASGEEAVVPETITENAAMEEQVSASPAESPDEPVTAMPPQTEAAEETAPETEPAAETEPAEPADVPDPDETVGDDGIVVETEAGPAEIVPPAPDYNTTVYIAVNVKARYHADPDSEYNGVIPAGTPVLAAGGIGDGWNEVQYNGEVYYVSSEWLSETYDVSETGMVRSIRLDRTSVEIAVGLSDMPWVTMLPADAADKSEIWTSSDESVATVDPYGRILGVAPGQCTVTVTSGARPDLSAEVHVTVCPGIGASEPTYIDGILIANKSYPLPETYNPGVDPDAQNALDALIAGAALDGVSLWMKSGFRSYETQKTLYNNYVARDGKEEADRYSARPGHSEHQTGLAFDLNSLEQSFGETKEGIWLAEHCAEYGFIIRYPAGKEEITGYMYEPWHIRYIGTEKAKLVTESGLCLEEYYDLPSYYAYG